MGIMRYSAVKPVAFVGFVPISGASRRNLGYADVSKLLARHWIANQGGR